MSIVDLGSYVPGVALGTDFYYGEALPSDPIANSPLFRAPKFRHHVGPGDCAAQMIAKAAGPMFERIGIPAMGNVDILITNVLLPDLMFTGCGAQVATLLSCRPEWIIDLHNGGCASFQYMLKLTQTIMDSSQARTALVCNVQNTAGQMFVQSEIRKLSHAAVPGDGCGVAYLVADGSSPVLGVETRHSPEFATDIGLTTQDGRKYWEAGTGQLDVKFNEDRTADIIARGNRLVPEVVAELCKRIGVSPADIDVLITNQPNRVFLRTWRDVLGIDQGKHLDTFDRFGNLYGAGAPITFEQAVRGDRIRDGDLVVLAGFAHAGDFAAAAAIRWHN